MPAGSVTSRLPRVGPGGGADARTVGQGAATNERRNYTYGRPPLA